MRMSSVQKEFCPFYVVLVFSWSQMTAMEMQFMFRLCLFKLKANQIGKPAPNPNPATSESFIFDSPGFELELWSHIDVTRNINRDTKPDRFPKSFIRCDLPVYQEIWGGKKNKTKSSMRPVFSWHNRADILSRHTSLCTSVSRKECQQTFAGPSKRCTFFIYDRQGIKEATLPTQSQLHTVFCCSHFTIWVSFILSFGEGQQILFLLLLGLSVWSP